MSYVLDMDIDAEQSQSLQEFRLHIARDSMYISLMCTRIKSVESCIRINFKGCKFDKLT